MTDWTDGNTQAAPMADDMDGLGADLVSGDTVNITKNLVINKTVGSGSITCPKLTINAGFTLTMDNGSSLNTSVGFHINGTFVGNDATLNCSGQGVPFPNNYAIFIGNGGVFNGGSGNHTFGSFGAAAGSNVTLTSGNTIIDNVSGFAATYYPGLALHLDSTAAFSHGNGKLIFTYAGIQSISCQNGRTFYNIQINNASCVLSPSKTLGGTITVTNLTLTAGAYSTLDAGGAVGRTLSIADGGTIDISAGALLNNAGQANIILGSDVQVSVSGTFRNRLTGFAQSKYIGASSPPAIKPKMTVNSGGVLDWQHTWLRNIHADNAKQPLDAAEVYCEDVTGITLHEICKIPIHTNICT